MGEIWKEVPGYEGLYQVSCRGQIKALTKKRRRKELIIKPWRASSGYLTVRLSLNGIKETRFVHRLILETFIGLSPDGMQCRHLDGSRTNNRLTNLTWGTVMENQNDRVAHGTSNRGEQHPNAKLCNLDIWLIRNCKVSQQKIAVFLNIDQSCVSRIRNHKVWRHV